MQKLSGTLGSMNFLVLNGSVLLSMLWHSPPYNVYTALNLIPLKVSDAHEITAASAICPAALTFC